MTEFKTEIKTKNVQDWSYETDVMTGTCLIAKDKMEIKFVFIQAGNEFYDVLKIDSEISKALKEPVTVEGMAESLIGTGDMFSARFGCRWPL